MFSNRISRPVPYASETAGSASTRVGIGILAGPGSVKIKAQAVSAQLITFGRTVPIALARLRATEPRLIAGIGVAVILSTLGVASARPAMMPPVPVRSERILVSRLPKGLRALGRVDSLGETRLVAPMTGEIVGPFETEGEVAAGAVIARNVPPNLQSAIASADADVATAQAAYARTRQMVTHRLGTRLALDEARRNLVNAKERLSGLHKEAEQEVITAPFAGTLHYVIAPDTVVYRGTPIATLSGRATPWIDVRVPPEAARGIHPGEPARVAASGWSGAGHVVSVGRDARPLGLVLVRIGLPDGNPLVPGQWAWVQLIRSGPPAPTAADSAVVMRGGRNMVFVLRRGIAHAVPVRVLAEQNGRAWLAGPLHAGEQVAVTHAARLVEGSRVTTRPDPSLGAAR